jgi:Flp pilus assembly protein TadD
MQCTRRKDITLTVDPSGYIFVSGPIHQDPKRWDELFVAKYDPQGSLVWQRDINRKSSLEQPYEAFSSAPPTAAHYGGTAQEGDDERDSVSPHAVDQEIEHLELQLTQRSRLSTALGYAAGFAFLVAVGFLSAAGFHQGRMQAAAQSVAAARSANLSDTGANAIDSAREAMDAALQGEAAKTSEPPELMSVEPNGSYQSVAPIIEASIEASIGQRSPTTTEPDALLGSAKLLRSETLALLNAGKSAEAVDAARVYVTVDSENAFSHLCLGAALQDLGRMKEARAAYSVCVKQAKRGAIWECRALGGR